WHLAHPYSPSASPSTTAWLTQLALRPRAHDAPGINPTNLYHSNLKRPIPLYPRATRLHRSHPTFGSPSRPWTVAEDALLRNAMELSYPKFACFWKNVLCVF